MTQTNHVVVMVGLPCSGKTHYSSWNYPKHKRISWDDTMLEMYPSSSYGESFEMSDDKEVRKKMYETLDKYIEDEEDVIMDLTHMGRKSRRKHLSKFPESYRTTAVVIAADPQTIQERNFDRGKEGKHIPEEVLIEMAERYEKPTDQEFDEIIYVDAWGNELSENTELH